MQIFTVDRDFLYFWRTYSGVEVDYVEEKDGLVSGFEFKWSSKSNRTPQAWKEATGDAPWQVVNPENAEKFIL